MHDPYESFVSLGWAVMLCAVWWVLAVVCLVITL